MLDENSLVKVHFELQNSPWHVRTVNWLDVVEAVPEAKDQLPEFVRVHKRSGHRTIHVYILDDGEKKKDEILQRCNELVCTWEGMDNRMYALDFPPDIGIDPAVEYLESLGDASMAAWRMNEYE